MLSQDNQRSSSQSTEPHYEDKVSRPAGGRRLSPTEANTSVLRFHIGRNVHLFLELETFLI